MGLAPTEKRRLITAHTLNGHFGAAGRDRENDVAGSNLLSLLNRVRPVAITCKLAIIALNDKSHAQPMRWAAARLSPNSRALAPGVLVSIKHSLALGDREGKAHARVVE